MADNNPDEELVITMLGAGQEVGRSCHLIEFKGKKILLVRVLAAFNEVEYFDMCVLTSIFGTPEKTWAFTQASTD